MLNEFSLKRGGYAFFYLAEEPFIVVNQTLDGFPRLRFRMASLVWPRGRRSGRIGALPYPPLRSSSDWRKREPDISRANKTRQVGDNNN